MLFKSTSAFKKQSVKPKKSGLENPLDSFLGRNSILDDKYEDTVSQKNIIAFFNERADFYFCHSFTKHLAKDMVFKQCVRYSMDILIIWVLKFSCNYFIDKTIVLDVVRL